jgi:hypothetical protein
MESYTWQNLVAVSIGWKEPPDWVSGRHPLNEIVNLKLLVAGSIG